LIEIVIAALVSNAIIFAILALLCKSIIKHWLDKDISTFKNKLQADAEKQLHDYKSELEKERIRLQISYGGIFEKQAEKILMLYQGLIDIEYVINNAVHGGGDPKLRKEEFRKEWEKLRQAHIESKVLIPEDIDDEFVKFLRLIFRSVLKLTSIDIKLDSGRRLTDAQFDQLYEKQDELYDIFEQKIPPLKELLIGKMRETLGVIHK